jgi:transposase
LLAELHPAIELKIARKVALEANLKNLTAEIEADKKRITELPGLTEKSKKSFSSPDGIKPAQDKAFHPVQHSRS